MKPRTEMLSDIRNAVAKVVPEIDTLRVPCLCRDHGHCPFKEHDRVGRPVRLADILAAINVAKMERWLIDYHGYFFSEIPTNKKLIAAPHETHYDLLHDDITLQTDELIVFLHSILCV